MFKQRHFTILCTQKKKQDGKMAHGSYSAWLGVCKVFVCFSCFCFSNKISFTRDELLNIRQNTPQNLLPDFNYSVVLLDIVVGGAVALVKCYRTCRRGKRAGTLVKLHWHNTGQHVTSVEFPADQIWSRCRINGEIARQRDMLLHQWEVVYICNCVKEDVLFRSRNALH